MALDALDTKITGYRDQAAELNTRFNATAKDIRDNTALSYEGKQAQIANA